MMEYKGLSIITSSEVYVPSDDSFLAADALADAIKDSRGKVSVLDMGAGTGILGLVAATSDRVSGVVLADINERAVSLCKENISLNSRALRAECKALKSDLFSNVEGKFDIIIFNAPYLRDEKDDKNFDVIEKAWAGGPEGVEVSINFLGDAKGHLEEGGKIIVIASSLSNLGLLSKEITRLGYVQESEKSLHIFFEDIIALTLRA